MIGMELRGLQRRSKDLEGLGKDPRGTSIFDLPKGGFHESQNLKKTTLGCGAFWTWHF